MFLLLRAAGSAGWRAITVLVPASLFFYATWNPLYCIPLLATAAIDFSVCRALGREKRPAVRRLLVAASLVADLGLLAFFKYFDLFARAFTGAAGPPFSVVFAAGISFYTFQSLSVVLDVYRNDLSPPRSFLTYLGFVSFFPTLLAGPITRGETLLPQLERPIAPATYESAARGLFLIALGFVKKAVIADTLGVNLVDRVFELPRLYSAGEVAVGIFAYAIQIWGDFAGYSDIAIGMALLLGFELKENFRFPYRSSDLAEFWRRWHISLSTWLRDYLFFSLPGNRRGSVLPYLNLVITFTLGGLWHGASWTFAVWGFLHGFGLAAVRLVESRRARGTKLPAWRNWLGTILTFHYVAFAWIFFRCPTLRDATEVLRVLAEGTWTFGNVPAPVFAAIAAGLVCQFLPENWLTASMRRFASLPAPAQAGLVLATAVAVRLASGSRVASFIYFAF